MSRISFDADAHRYTVDGVVVPSVTQVLGRTVPKHLTSWAAGMAARYACTHWAELTQVDVDERRARIARAHSDYSQERMQRGTDIHATAQQVIYGKPVEVAAYIDEAEAYARFLDDYDVQPIATESVVAAPSLSYAGSADLWATIGARDNQRALLDIKTGSGVYDEVSLQLAAYRYAELMRYDDGHEAPPPEVDAAYVVHIRRDKRTDEVIVDVRPVRADADDFQTFCALLRFSDWLRSKPVGKPLAQGVAA